MLINFAVINPDGSIKRTGSCSQSLFEMQGDFVVECGLDIKDSTHSYNFETSSLTEIAPIQITIEEVRAEKLKEIKFHRDVMENGGCATPFGPAVDTDANATKRISGAVQMAVLAKMTAQPFSQSWTMKDNSQVVVDADGMIAIGMAVANNTKQAFEIAKGLKAQLEAATTVEQVNAIVWP